MKNVTLFLTVLLLTACQQDKGDLTAYISEIQARQKAEIDAIPEMATYQRFNYSASQLRNPFIQTVVEMPELEQTKVVIDNGIHPDRTRVKEELEAYKLAELRLVGTLQQDIIWALVRSPEGIIHRVKQGDYMGKNDGRIVIISDIEVVLTEIIAKGDGSFIERDASLSLIDVN